MRWSSLAGCCSLLFASQLLVACGDDDDGTPVGVAGSSVGGSSAGKSSTAGSDTGGSDEGGKGGTFGTAGTDAGGKGGTDAGGGGTGGTGGTGPLPDCVTDVDCVSDDGNACTDNKCVDGKCEDVANDDNECDDGNDCTDNKCSAGKCEATNRTGNCDDLSSCTPGQDTCTNGVCGGPLDADLCPVCNTVGNMIKNCDFSDGLTSWADAIAFSGGAATQNVINGRDVIAISAGGDFVYSVQPRQEPLALKQGYKYKFGLVAGSSYPRDAAVALTQAAGMYLVYSTGNNPGGGFTMALEPQMKPFAFEFFMTQADDANVKLEIKLGNAAGAAAMPANDTYFDDVYVREIKCAVPADCNDGNECTTDACDAVTGKCTWTNNTSVCTDDGESCTTDVCAAGVCTHPALADGQSCPNEATDTANCTKNQCTAGKCEHPWDNASTCTCTTNTQCNDADACTTDSCDIGGTGKCSYAASTAACDDGVLCTATDVCANFVCGGTNICYAGCATGNLLMTCDFATADVTPWQVYAANGDATTLSVVDGRMNARVTAINQNVSGNDYDLQVYQAGFNLEKNKTYRVKLNVVSSVARKIFVGVTHNGGGFETLKGDTYDVTPEMKAITFDIVTDDTFVPPPAMEGYKFEIRLGKKENNPTPFVAHNVQIDNVSIAAVAP